MLKIKKPTKEQVLKFLKNNLLVVLGTFILAFGVEVFLVPFDLVTGGVSGLAIIVRYISGGRITVELAVTVITWALFFLGLVVLGKSFSLRTLCSTIVYPLFLTLSMKLVQWMPFLQLDAANDMHLFLAAIFSGVLVGAGCAVTFIGGGSTGGLDVLAFILAKITHVKSSIYVFALDASIVVIGLCIFQNLPACLLGVTSAFIAALVIDKLFLGESKQFMAYIISDKYEEINKLVIEKLDRTSTVLDCVGGYSNENKKMLAVCFTMDEYNGLMNIVSSVDKKAFMTINRAHAITGEGFEPLPTKKRKEM